MVQGFWPQRRCSSAPTYSSLTQGSFWNIHQKEHKISIIEVLCKQCPLQETLSCCNNYYHYALRWSVFFISNGVFRETSPDSWMQVLVPVPRRKFSQECSLWSLFLMMLFSSKCLLVKLSRAILSPRHLNVDNIQPLIPFKEANNLGSLLAGGCMWYFIIFT